MENQPAWRSLLRSFVGSATVSAALLVYFGWLRSKQIAEGMGYDPTLLNLSTQDYTLRAISSVSRLAIVVSLGAVMWRVVHDSFAHSAMRKPSPDSPGCWTRKLAFKIGRSARFLVLAGWLVAFVFVVIALFVTMRGKALSLIVPIGLVISAALFAYGSWFSRFSTTSSNSGRPLTASSRSGIQALLAVALFFAISSQASISGQRQAQNNWNSIESGKVPLATLTSDTPLALGGIEPYESPAGLVYQGVALWTTENGHHFLAPTNSRNRRALFVIPTSGLQLSLDSDRSVHCGGFEDLELGTRYDPGDAFWSGGVRYLVGSSSVDGAVEQSPSFIRVVSGDSGQRLEIRSATLKVDLSVTRFGRWEVQYEQIDQTGVEASASSSKSVVGSTLVALAVKADEMGAQGRSTGTFWIDGPGDNTLERLEIGGEHVFLDC